ncbi:hypothetical protein ACFWHB_10685 [Aeromonas mytilicola subsp. aquatica]|uniref:hypothetical protein n=1 Tax=Aeromonas mytilicola TaxID=3377113 RepID=UPI0037BEAA77
MKKSKAYIVLSISLPLCAHAETPSDVDSRWRQSATITHPEHSFYPNQNVDIQATRKNIFDWRTQHFQIGMANWQGSEELAVSPFYICEVESLYNIPGGKLLTSDIMGPGNMLPPSTTCARNYKTKSYLNKIPDMSPDEGWEIVKFNLGYKMSHYKNAKTSWSADGSDSFTTNQYPYIILYNRMTAKLRVMGFFPGYALGTGMSVILATSGKTKIFNGTKAVDAKFFNSNKTGFGAINNSQDGAWGIADFNLDLDPCSPGMDIDLTVSIKPEAVADVELYGHSIGISQNITDENIGDPSRYLMDVSGDLQDNLDQAGSYTVSSLNDLNELFNGVNDSATSNAVASDALGAASAFLGGLMELAPGGSTVTAGLKAMSGVLGGAGSIMGTQAAAVQNFSPIIPQITFSEIYLRGTSTLSDNGINVKLRLPGSLNTAWKNFDENAVTNLSYPLYDEPMGLFTLLTTPKVRVTKTYSERDSTQGYKVVTKFNPANVILASNYKSGLSISGFAAVEENGLNVTGRLKVRYLVDSNITPTFTNLHDIDGDDNSFSYVKNTTNGRDTKLYTVVTDEVPLMHLNRILGTKTIPSITIKGGTAVVDNVSLVVTAKNNSDTLHDNILNQDIKMANGEDSSGDFVPYYISMKEYPTIFNESGNSTFSPNEDINRLINTQQIGISETNSALGLDIRLGKGNSPSIKGYCSASGEYNKPQINTYYSDGTYSMVSDEDMAYYAYEPKQVSAPSTTRIQLAKDDCSFCANSKTFSFISFNLNEYIGLYGFRDPKNVSVRIYKHGGGAFSLLDYQSKYYLSANKSTPAMISTEWGDSQPEFSTMLKYNIHDSPYSFNVTQQFKAALARVKNSDGKYEQPRLSFALSPESTFDTYPQINSSEGSSSVAPRLIINF